MHILCFFLYFLLTCIMKYFRVRIMCLQKVWAAATVSVRGTWAGFYVNKSSSDLLTALHMNNGAETRVLLSSQPPCSDLYLLSDSCWPSSRPTDKQTSCFNRLSAHFVAEDLLCVTMRHHVRHYCSFLFLSPESSFKSNSDAENIHQNTDE